jgi:hypothetical protein
MATWYRASGRILCAYMLAIGVTAAPSQPGKPLPALSRLEPGLWQIREIDNAHAAPHSICISDPGMLTQLQHRQSPCSRFIIANEAQLITVHYTCPANGFGRTSVRVETSRLAKIDTQGIVDNAPFAYRAEARRVGDCTRTAKPASTGRSGR